MTQPPLADEGLATVFDVGRRGGVDHIGVIGGHLVVQALGRVGEQVPMLVHGTSLYGMPSQTAAIALSSPARRPR